MDETLISRKSEVGAKVPDPIDAPQERIGASVRFMQSVPTGLPEHQGTMSANGATAAAVPRGEDFRDGVLWAAVVVKRVAQDGAAEGRTGHQPPLRGRLRVLSA
ncbi:hypothetical protein ACFYW8_35545 [Streptomyces sp. NPDC002742]|uniref:hypothetical protein n=1 Tax=Streptomyces sp. NPDC002742 TaxID=3364663 RepID=UPI00369292B4